MVQAFSVVRVRLTTSMAAGPLPHVTQPVTAAPPVATQPVAAAQPVARQSVTAAQPVATQPVDAAQPVSAQPVTAAQPVATQPVTAQHVTAQHVNEKVAYKAPPPGQRQPGSVKDPMPAPGAIRGDLGSSGLCTQTK